MFYVFYICICFYLVFDELCQRELFLRIIKIDWQIFDITILKNNWKTAIFNLRLYKLKKQFNFLNCNNHWHIFFNFSFRACLKTVGTSDANLVGKLFFNIVQTQCFLLKPKKKCIRTSWWGNCLKYKMVKQAYIKDNRPF